MNSTRQITSIALLLLAGALRPAAAKEAVDYVDPFIGTGGQGKDFPGANVPFSMVKLSPDTVVTGPTSYYYSDKTIQGFSFTHLGGADGGELGNFLVMPTSGPLQTYGGQRGKPHTGYLSSFSKPSEKAAAGYYAVTLDDYKVRAEATVASRSGMLRFTFPANAQSRIQIDLAHRINGTSLHQTVKVVDDHSIEGMIDCPTNGGGWGFGGNIHYTLYYRAEFSEPFTKYGVWSAALPPDWSAAKPSVPYGKLRNVNSPDFIEACKNAEVIPGCREKEGQHLGFYSEFPTKEGEAVMMKAGLSFVSIAGARANLAAEMPDWSFERVQQQARDAWVKELDHLAVEGGTEEHKTIYYSALYRALLYPMTFGDLDGNYFGGDGKAHHSDRFTNRTIFSGWDEYRSKYPLLTLVDPKVVNDQINSMVELADANGTKFFDRWEIMGNYTTCMIGNPEVVVLNDAYQKGIRGYDMDKAYPFAINTSEKYGNGKYGYMPDRISETTEYGLDEWNMAQLASALGKKEDAAKYLDRSKAYQKLFDPAQAWTYDAEGKDARPEWKGWFRLKDGNGNFQPWLGLLSPKGTCEATMYQAGWTAYNDIPGMIKLLGGNQLFTAKLNDFFERAPDFSKWNPYMGIRNPAHVYGGQEPWWNPYNNPVNEPTELIAFLFNRAGAPHLTQKWVRQSQQVYYTGPDGLPGDDDVGQMSAWYVLAAAGLTQGCPGDPRFEIFTPMFDKVTVKLDPEYAKGKSFVITSRNQSPDNLYIQAATLNGQPLNRCWLNYAEIAAGGTLELVLGPRPQEKWGTE